VSINDAGFMLLNLLQISMQRITSSTLTSGTDLLPQDRTQYSRSLEERGLHITYGFQPASELDLPAGVNEHLLIVFFNGDLRQIRRYVGQELDAPSRPGDIFLAPAATPSFHAWECDRADEAIMFFIDPQHLQQFAAENNVLHPELRPYEGGLSSYQLRHALDFIHAYLNCDFKLQEIADCLGISSQMTEHFPPGRALPLLPIAVSTNCNRLITMDRQPSHLGKSLLDLARASSQSSACSRDDP
jgi:hypothetical protein